MKLSLNANRGCSWARMRTRMENEFRVRTDNWKWCSWIWRCYVRWCWFCWLWSYGDVVKTWSRTEWRCCLRRCVECLVDLEWCFRWLCLLRKRYGDVVECDRLVVHLNGYVFVLDLEILWLGDGASYELHNWDMWSCWSWTLWWWLSGNGITVMMMLVGECCLGISWMQGMCSVCSDAAGTICRRI